MKQLIRVLEKINKQLEISNKISSSKLVIDTIESNTLPIVNAGDHLSLRISYRLLLSPSHKVGQ